MIEMTDTEFVEGIKARLHEKGWQRGRIGTAEGPNCLLGAAGFVAHNGDLVVDSNGYQPIKLDDKELFDDQRDYKFVPGMVRLAELMGVGVVNVGTLNDRCTNVDEAITVMECRVGNV